MMIVKINKYMVFYFVVLFSIGFVVECQVSQQVLNKLVCIEQEECGACLSAASHCRWCADPYYHGPARCNDHFSLEGSGCSQATIQRPYPSHWEVIENASLQDMQPNNQEAVVQIQPQRIRLSLKPKETQKIKFTYRVAKNYPLDLYYLMDLTWSMKDDKETLVSLQDDLPSMLKNLTDNFRIGFGSFAEKPMMPFISMDVKRRKNPCTVESEACEPTYSYRHHLSLTDKVEEFIKQVNSSSVTANLDNAEAQLDALVQAVVCSDRIGWATKSRKIVILLSDGLMHTAGDGKLGGAIRRNDERCHLDESGYYSEAATYDYPSVAQIYRLLDKHKVNVIFAVTQNVKDHYDSLHNILEDFTIVAKLESDSSNILKLVKGGYESIASVIDFKDDSKENGINTKYFTNCGVKEGSMIEATRCVGVEFGMILDYEVHVSFDSCPESKKINRIIKISESQLGQDTLTLEVDLHCGCECSKENEYQRQMAVVCPPNSLMVCGVCQCIKGWSGPLCDCSIEDDQASALLLSQCREPNATHSLPCSGSGDCRCGKCDCDRGRIGKYCQCTACGLSSENGQECGGPGRGACVCGQCACATGWEGATCDCPLDKSTCVPPAGGEVCSDHGECVCGRCKCSLTSDGITKYTGSFCESCPTCVNPLCSRADDCVSCHLSNNCTGLCLIGDMNYTVTENIDDKEYYQFDPDSSCIFRRDEDGYQCEYRYTYATSEEEKVAMEIVIRSKLCYKPVAANAMNIAIIIVICILLVGILFIIFIKITHTIQDRRAYSKFFKEANESQVKYTNPLYKSPITEFKMPEDFPRNMNE